MPETDEMGVDYYAIVEELERCTRSEIQRTSRLKLNSNMYQFALKQTG